MYSECTNANWCYHHCYSLASAIVCGAPSFSCGVTMEPFSSTIVGSEIHYQCQPGFLPEGRRTLLCGGDGMWNPDPQHLCTGNPFRLPSHSSFWPHFSSVPFFFPQSLFLLQTQVCLQLLLQPLQLFSAYRWHSSLGFYVVVWSQFATGGGTTKDIALIQHQTFKNSNNKSQSMRR